MRAYTAPSAAFAPIDAGIHCVSIWNALFGSLGRVSSSLPASSGRDSVVSAQKCGVKNATGPRKFSVLRKRVQHWFPVGTFLPAVTGLGSVRGSGR